MSKFNPDNGLIMNQFKTVDDFNLPRGTALAITDSPAGAGQVTPETAERLWASGIAVYAQDYRPTPVAAEEPEAPVKASPEPEKRSKPRATDAEAEG